MLNNPLRFTDPDGLAVRATLGSIKNAFNWSLRKGEESARWYAGQYNKTGNLKYKIGGYLSSAWSPKTFTNDAGKRALTAAKAELGIFAGAAQLTYSLGKRGIISKAIGGHGIGNYFGSIGDLSNVIHGQKNDWNVTRQAYENISEKATGQKTYGTAAFYSVDLGMGLYMAGKPVKVVDQVRLSNGVKVERSRQIPEILTQSTPVIFHDIVQLGISFLSAIDNSPSKEQ